MNSPKIIRLKEQGFCYGVKRAIKIVEASCQDQSLPRPIYLLGNLVHNDFIKHYLDKLNIIIIDGDNRLQMLDSIPNNCTVIFSAHGVSNQVRAKAIAKNLTIIDATCPYVEQTFKLVEHACIDHDILFIGKANHPETEAVLELSNRAYLVNPKLLKIDGLDEERIMVAHQTTMSCYDIDHLFAEIKNVYPKAKKLDMICRVTEKRQYELKTIDSLHFPLPGLIIIVGDKKSNNSTKLYELALRSNKCDAVFIESISDLNLHQVKKYQTIIIGSGTSTPISLINEIENVINHLDEIDTEYIISQINENNLIK